MEVSRLFAAAAAAASSPSPLSLARRITSRGVPSPQGRRWYSEKVDWREDSSLKKVNLWEDPTSPMRWKISHFVTATFTAWGVCMFGWFKFFDGEEEQED